MLKKIIDLPKRISPNLRKIIGNTAWLFGEKMFQMGFGFLVGAWVARYLAPERYGVINYAWAMMGLFGPIAQLGLEQIVVRDLAKNTDNKEETLGTSFILKAISSVTTYLIVIVAVYFLNPGKPTVLWVTAILSAGVSFKAFDSINYWFQSQVQSKYTVWARTSSYIFINIIKIILIQIQAPLLAFAIALACEQAITSVSLILVYQTSTGSLLAWRVKWERAKSLLKDSWPLILSGIVIMIYMRIDQVMLGQMKGTEAVGVYSVAVKISELWYFVPQAIINSVFPSIVQAKEISEELYYKRLQKIFNFVATTGYIFAIGITLTAPYIINLFYGPQYAEAAGVLTISIWAGIFVALGLARETWLTTEGLMKFSAATTSVGAVVNVVLNLLFIDKYGAIGAAVATVISQAVASYIAGAFYPQTWPIFLRQTKALTLVGWFKS
ncbi:MAG: flippase [Spirulinaceae cyanobacterium]